MQNRAGNNTDSKGSAAPLEPVQNPYFRVVLVTPEIPQNTGNIGRTCVGLNSSLDLVGPLGFELSHARLKRAGLDYWPQLSWANYQNWDHWRQKNLTTRQQVERTFFFSAKASKLYYDIPFATGDKLVFGCETQGLPDPILEEYFERTYLIPTPGPVRGYNLATAVAIVLFEAYRQVYHLKSK
jgi:tRNA (cytidine/uridine-2'-O-)-methyltransferase